MENMPIEDIKAVLTQAGINYTTSAAGSEMFERIIQFEVNGLPYWINWHTNISYLTIGKRYSNEIPFLRVNRNDTWPSYCRGLRFADEQHTCYVTIKPLSWQEKHHGQDNGSDCGAD